MSASASASASPSPGPPCPNYNNAAYTDQSLETYDITCNQTYSGTVITSQSQMRVKRQTGGGPASTCLSLCDTYSNCVAISSNSTTCTLFSQITDLTYEGGSTAALLVSAGNQITPSGAVSVVTVTQHHYYCVYNRDYDDLRGERWVYDHAGEHEAG
ncbi:hypothetical protein LTR86_003311 [Recurvomyces mirabilis]|nr:hypothetical protein LTR86_003311 [Recurvomyces mirabilis]